MQNALFKKRAFLFLQISKSLPCLKGGGKTAGFDGGIFIQLGVVFCFESLSLLLRKIQLPLGKGAF